MAVRNTFCEASDEPVGACIANGGRNDCPKWPSVNPSPCCWLTCSELCAVSCYKGNGQYGKHCKYYRGR